MQGKNMSFELRSRIPRTLLVVVSVLVVLGAVQTLVFVPTAQATVRPRLCVVGGDGDSVACPPIPNPCGGYCYAVGCNGGGCVYQCTCPIP